MKKFICFIAVLLFCFSCCATSKKAEAKTTMFVSEQGDRLLLSRLANGKYLATLYIMGRIYRDRELTYVANAYATVEGNKISFTTTMLYNPKDFNLRYKKEKPGKSCTQVSLELLRSVKMVASGGHILT